MRGVVKKWDDSKGYGFIVDEKGRIYFVHYTALEMVGFRTLQLGAKVEFDAYETSSGMEAKSVVVIG